jgi:hypothetical protein
MDNEDETPMFDLTKEKIVFLHPCNDQPTTSFNVIDKTACHSIRN